MSFSRLILPRYIWREVFILYCVGVLILLILQTNDTLTSAAGIAIRNKTPLGILGELLLYRLPYFIYVALPFGLPFAILLTFGRLAKDSELKVIYASGIRPLALIVPLVLFGGLVSVVSFWNNNAVRPIATQTYNQVLYKLWYNQAPPRYTTLYIEPDGTTGNLFYAGSLQEDTTSPLKLTRIYGAMVRTPEATYTAPSGIWNQATKQWELSGVWEYRKPEIAPVFYPKKVFAYQEEFKPFLKEPETQSLTELKASISDTSLPSLEQRQALFEYYRRFSDSLAPLVFAFASAVLGLLLRNRSWAFASVIVMLFGYWVIYAAVPQFVLLDALPVLLSAWLPNVILLLCALVLVRKLW